jgi:hypothetical protein
MLLAGSIRATELSGQTHRHPLMLPLAKGRTILSQWQAMLSCDADCGIELTSVRALVGHHHAANTDASTFDAPPDWQVITDAAPLRGSGGVVRDACMVLDDDDFVTVFDAAQVLRTPVWKLIAIARRVDADVVVLSAESQRTSAIRARVGILKEISSRGYVDLKEQALASIAKHHTVRMISVPGPDFALPVRTLVDYRDVLRMVAGHALTPSVFNENWQSRFIIVEIGASVAGSAKLNDTVVLDGGRVERDAVVVRSVVAKGGVVRAGTTIIDQIVDKPTGVKR